jgi:hypothetical protein
MSVPERKRGLLLLSSCLRLLPKGVPEQGDTLFFPNFLLLVFWQQLIAACIDFIGPRRAARPSGQ